MDAFFSGSIARQRQINLGGNLPGPSSSSRLAAEARSSRQARDLARRQELAATKVQKVWRGSRVRDEKRQWRKRQFQRLLNEEGALSAAHGHLDFDKAVQATVALAEAVQTRHVARMAQRRPQDRTATESDDLIRTWCEAMVQPLPADQGKPLVIVLGDSRTMDSDWGRAASLLLEEIHLRLLHQASYLTDNAKFAFLKLYETLWANQRTSSLEQGHYDVFGAVLLSLPTDRKNSNSPTLCQLVARLLMMPFSFKTTMGQADKPSVRSQYTKFFAEVILRIPFLPNRLPLLEFAQIAANFPLSDVVNHMRSVEFASEARAPSTMAAHQLANILALASQRITRFGDGKTLASYLEVITSLQDQVPVAFLTTPRTLTGDVDTETQKRLAVLPSVKHISAILNVSAKSPSTTRPALYAFLCSLLFSWPEDTRNTVFNVVLYGLGVEAGTASSALAGGFVREIWRGYLRSSALSRGLGNPSSANGSKALRQDKEGWPALVLLLELYSKLLLTLGDDEFLPPRGGINDRSAYLDTSHQTARVLGSSSGGASSSQVAVARNPLSIDEVLSFGAVLRNLAFSLYWELDVSVGPSSQAATRGGVADTVPGLRLSFLALRDGATRLLQQLHARDARHRFTPDDFWLMTKDMDIESFVESVLLEEDKIAGDNAEAEAAASEAAAAAAAAGDGIAAYDDEDDHDRVSLEVAVPRHALPSRRHISARKLAFISPRLGILNNLPFVLPFATRVEIFETFVFRDARRHGIRQNTGFQRRKRVTIRRDHVAEDGMAQLNGLGSALKESIEIVFVDQFGMTEAGIDGGGVFKEFLTSLAREAFDTDRGLWKATEQEELFPNPQSYARQSEQLSWYAFLGRILGKALYEGILVDVRFAPFFLSKCLGRRGLSHLDDLASLDSLDSELYRGLIYLKNYTGDVEQDLSLNFTVTDEEFGVRKSTELMPNGANIAVTNKNRLSYIFLVANYRLDAQIRAQCNAFFAGLSELIDPRWLRIFNQTELQELIKGSDSPIDIADLRAHTVLSDYHEKDLTMTYLWETLESFDQPTRAQFLKFVTSCPSPPLLGFGQLNPRFCVRCSGDDEQRLPTSSTCVNLLKLPRYNSLETTKEKLLLAIRSGAGFDLS